MKKQMPLHFCSLDDDIALMIDICLDNSLPLAISKVDTIVSSAIQSVSLPCHPFTRSASTYCICDWHGIRIQGRWLKILVLSCPKGVILYRKRPMNRWQTPVHYTKCYGTERSRMETGEPRETNFRQADQKKSQRRHTGGGF